MLDLVAVSYFGSGREESRVLNEKTVRLCALRFVLEMFNWTDNKAVTIHYKLEPLLLLDSLSKIGLNAENWVS